MYISKLKVDDIPDVMRTAEECRLCPWSAAAYIAEVRRGEAIMLKLATADVGFAGFAVGRVLDETGTETTAELLNIGVREKFQGNGYGSMLLRSFIVECVARRATTLLLEVRRSNTSAIRFYRLFGFQKIAVRKGFYSGPVEDAITMKLDLKNRNSAQQRA